jgi:hypothetical protein
MLDLDLHNSGRFFVTKYSYDQSEKEDENKQSFLPSSFSPALFILKTLPIVEWAFDIRLLPCTSFLLSVNYTVIPVSVIVYRILCHAPPVSSMPCPIDDDTFDRQQRPDASKFCIVLHRFMCCL